MSQTITIPAKTIEQILTRLDALSREVKAIKTRLFEEEPTYGSDAWWEWSNKKAIEEIKAGKGIKFNTAKEAMQWLNS